MQLASRIRGQHKQSAGNLLACVTLLLFAATVSTCQTATPQILAEPPGTAVPQESENAGALKSLHDSFRPAYEAARDDARQQFAAVVIVRRSDMFLLRRGEIIAEGKCIPTKYFLLHRTAHVPLVTYLRVSPYFVEPLPQSVKDALAIYAGQIGSAVSDTSNYGFTSEEIQWQVLILEQSRTFLTDLTAGEPVTEERYAAYRALVSTAMMQLADAAGAAQIDATNKLIESWLPLLSNDEQQGLLAVIIGPRQPRQGNVATQYFASLLRGNSDSIYPGETERVYYVESLDIDRTDRAFKKELDAVAALVLDRQASSHLFNNPYRMSIDVMADGAARRIAELRLPSLNN